jgi:hypothetical protein
MTIVLRRALRSASIISNTALLACLSVVSLQAQTNATAAAPPKTGATNAKTANPAATTAKPATAGAAKPMVNAGAAPQANAQVANSGGLVPAGAQAPIQSAPAAVKPNAAMTSPASNATAPAATPGASPTAAAPASWSPAVASQGGSPTAASPAGTVTSASSSGNGSRSAVGGLGVGTFLWPGGWTLTAYGCFRTGTRLFCDFDTINQNNLQAGSNIWSGGGGVNLVDDGGKITVRHNAFFVGQDGSQFPTAYISPQPVRFIIEYDDVNPSYTAVSLVLGRERIQGVPITLIDPSQPQGKMPARPVVSNVATSGTNAATGVNAATPAATGTQQAGQPGTGVLDKADSTVNNANNQKKKAQSIWKSLQGVAQSH